jgi:hypothetical protein
MHIPSNALAHGPGETIQPELATARASTRLTGLSRSTSVKTRPDGLSGVIFRKIEWWGVAGQSVGGADLGWF